MTLPVFVINLDRRRDRWAAMQAQLDRLGLAATRIPAIDKDTLAGDSALLRLSAGHVACARSHYRALEALVARHAPAGLILEDDAEVGESVRSLIESPEWWPGEYGLIQLECPRKPRPLCLGRPVGTTPDGRFLRPLVTRNVGGCGYLIDQDTALEVLEVAPAVTLPIDHLLFDLRFSRLARSLRPLQMVPGLVRHRPDMTMGSDTGPTRVNGCNPWKPSPFIRAWQWAPRVLKIATGKAERVRVGYAG